MVQPKEGQLGAITVLDEEQDGSITASGSNIYDVNGLVLNEQGSFSYDTSISGTEGAVWLRDDGYLIFTDQFNTDHVIDFDGVGVGGSGTISQIQVTSDGITSVDVIDITNPSGPTVIIDLPNIKINNTENDVIIGAGTPAIADLGSKNTILGDSAGSVFTGSSTVFLGANAGIQATGNGQTIIGSDAGINLTTGLGNLIIGEGVGDTLETGSGNTLIGIGADVGSAGDNNITNIANVIKIEPNTSNLSIGRDTPVIGALSGTTTIIGHNAGTSFIGSGSTFIGSNAGSSVTGNGTIAIGYGSAASLTSGTGNILLGATASTLTTGNGNVLIGTGVDTPASNTNNFLNIAGALTGVVNGNKVAVGDDTRDLSGQTEAFAIYGDGYVEGNFEIEGKLTVNGLIDPTGIVLSEQSSSPNINNIDEGSVWVRDDGYLIFTDQSNIDHTIDLDGTGGGTNLSAPSDPADDGLVAIASGGDLTYAKIDTAQIEIDAITTSLIADGAVGPAQTNIDTLVFSTTSSPGSMTVQEQVIPRVNYSANIVSTDTEAINYSPPLGDGYYLLDIAVIATDESSNVYLVHRKITINHSGFTDTFGTPNDIDTSGEPDITVTYTQNGAITGFNINVENLTGQTINAYASVHAVHMQIPPAP